MTDSSAKRYPDHVQSKSEQMMFDDFRHFLYALWKHLQLPKPTKVQLLIAWFLQYGPRRLMIQAFRGVGKSWITAAFVLWLLYRNAEEKILVVSASEDKAVEFSTFTKRLINEVPFLTHLRARDGQRDSTLAFDVGPARPAQAPSVRAVGIGGQITGGRATVIIPDDVEIPGNSDTEPKREKLKARVAELGGAILSPGGRVVYLGTPQSVQTVYADLADRGYEIRIWPSRYWNGVDPETGADVYQGRLCPTLSAELSANPQLAGIPTDPERFSDLELLEREGEYGPSAYRLQFQLDTSLSDANKYPLRQRDLIVMDVDKALAPVQLTWSSSPDLENKDITNVGLNGDRLYRPMYASPEFAHFTGSVMYIDSSGRGDNETSYAVTKFLNGMIYVRRWGGFLGGYDTQTLKALATIAFEERVNKVMIEGNFGDGMFQKLFEPVLREVYVVRDEAGNQVGGAGCAVEEFKVAGIQKERRVCDKLEPALSSHRIVMDRQCALDNSKAPTKDQSVQYAGLYQLTHITRAKGSLRWDDRIDVLAEAVGHWVESVARDTKGAEAQHRARMLLAEIKKHQEQVSRLNGGQLNALHRQQRELRHLQPKPMKRRRNALRSILG